MGKLDHAERELLEQYESGELVSVKDVRDEIARYQTYAQATHQKDKRVNIRISSKDLEALQKRALREGIPYQTLMSSVLHKFVEGDLVDNPQ